MTPASRGCRIQLFRQGVSTSLVSGSARKLAASPARTFATINDDDTFHLHGKRQDSKKVTRRERKTSDDDALSEVERFLRKLSGDAEKQHKEDVPFASSSQEDIKKMQKRYDALLSAFESDTPSKPIIKIEENASWVRKGKPWVDRSFFSPKIQAPSYAPSTFSKVSSVAKKAATKFKFPSATHRVSDLLVYNPALEGETVVVHGFIRSVRSIHKGLSFLDLHDFYSGEKESVQIVSRVDKSALEKGQSAIHRTAINTHPFIPVCITGSICKGTQQGGQARTEIILTSILRLNTVPRGLIYSQGTEFPPEKRHLQLRTSQALSAALRLRAKVSAVCRSVLDSAQFMEVETPLLFKSTPEGAREFLVPTRTKEAGGALCYALPQSPQQYKQILMASGVPRYYQLAKCFRDEDLRADRQPEFTQLDLEMSFAKGEDVMKIIENLLSRIWKEAIDYDISQFRRMTYHDAMKAFGSDKPDLRYSDMRIHRIGLKERKGYAIDAFVFRSENRLSDFHKEFEREYFGRQDHGFKSYIAGKNAPRGIPEFNLTSEDMEVLHGGLEIEPGNIVVLKERENVLSGGNTELGLYRTALINKAISKELIPKREGFEFVWITEFPLFSPSTDAEPGQGGTAGLSSTHHPFTAPHEDDFPLLVTSPQTVRAEHYDIVVNGVELGGGSRRIHDPTLQKYILAEVIQVPPHRLHQFDHLLEVLGSGCPPHAGIALGFDRMIAILSGTDSVRDVIAFPKSAKGADLLVGSPSKVSPEELATYHLRKIGK